MGTYVFGGQKPAPKPKRKIPTCGGRPQGVWPGRILHILGDREMQPQDLAREVYDAYGGNLSTIRTTIFKMQRRGQLEVTRDWVYDKRIHQRTHSLVKAVNKQDKKDQIQPEAS